MLPYILKQKSTCQGKWTRYCTIFYVPIHSMSTSFFENLLFVQSWIRCRISLLSLPNHESKWPWVSFYIGRSLTNCAMNHRNDFFFVLQPFLTLVLGHRMAPIMYTQVGKEIGKKSCKQIYLWESYIQNMKSLKRQKIIMLQIKRGSQSYRDWTEFFELVLIN